MDADVQTALNAFDEAVREALKSSYQEGKQSRAEHPPEPSGKRNLGQRLQPEDRGRYGLSKRDAPADDDGTECDQARAESPRLVRIQPRTRLSPEPAYDWETEPVVAGSKTMLSTPRAAGRRPTGGGTEVTNQNHKPVQLGPVNTYLSVSKMSTKWMKPMNITSFRRKWNTESGGSGTAIPEEVEQRIREVEHGIRRKWNIDSGGSGTAVPEVVNARR